MSEQPGEAAGTAEPTETPLNFNKPWTVGKIFTVGENPALIKNSTGEFVAHVPWDSRSVEHVHAIARHIVACVNFCAQLDAELLDELSAGHFEITCKRINPILAAELADNSKQFHADQADKPVAVLTGGAI